MLIESCLTFLFVKRFFIQGKWIVIRAVNSKKDRKVIHTSSRYIKKKYIYKFRQPCDGFKWEKAIQNREKCSHFRFKWFIVLIPNNILLTFCFQGVHFVTSQHFWIKAFLCSVAQTLAAERLVCVPGYTSVWVLFQCCISLCSDLFIKIRSLAGSVLSPSFHFYFWVTRMVTWWRHGAVEKVSRVCGLQSGAPKWTVLVDVKLMVFFHWLGLLCWN